MVVRHSGRNQNSCKHRAPGTAAAEHSIRGQVLGTDLSRRVPMTCLSIRRVSLPPPAMKISSVLERWPVALSPVPPHKACDQLCEPGELVLGREAAGVLDPFEARVWQLPRELLRVRRLEEAVVERPRGHGVVAASTESGLF
jgi:hypothetical protein